MKYSDQLESDRQKLRDALASEEGIVPLKLIKKPNLIDELSTFDYSELDTLSIAKLESYMGAIAQYLIFMQKHVNQLRIGNDSASRAYQEALLEEALKQDGKNMKEKEAKASVLPEIREVSLQFETSKARLCRYDKIPDHYKELLQSIKKIYSARVDERSTQDV